MECNTTVSACNVSTPGSVEYIERSVFIQIVVLTIMAVLGVGGNIIILATGVKGLFCVPDLRLRQEYTPSFITNLAVADILILMYCVPLHLSEVKRLPMSEFVCRYLVPLRDTLALTAILTIMAISLERAVAILHPFSLESSQRYTRHWIIVIWIVSYLFAGLPMVFVMSSHSGQFCIRKWSSVRLRNVHQMSAILLIVIPGIITTFSYMFCIRALHKFRQRRKNSVESTGVQQWSFIKQTRSVSRIALVLVVVYWLCNLPLVTYAIVANYRLIAPSPKEHAYTMAVLTCLFFGASVMNPIVLIAMSHLYRESAVTCVQYIFSKGNPIVRYRSRVQFTRESTNGNRSEHISIANNEDNGENNNANGFMLTARK
ncbi:neuropeptide FF receptor 2-like [Paramuricea clavata]|uniref:Neuropeptide FF receptor 2-like n=1 Tax=Paramuricea clavata TaxID=317549 RepID=A0A6S7GK53_PARCT|nr:neuropeptide FF receptor 2-like [Paramuricea clavata]